MKELTQQQNNQTAVVVVDKPTINQEEAIEPSPIDEKTQLSVEQLQTNEINLICENNVLIETCNWF